MKDMMIIIRNMKMKDYKRIRDEFRDIINKYSLEGYSNTPDFILADYLIQSLDNFNNTTVRRQEWYKDHQGEIDERV